MSERVLTLGADPEIPLVPLKVSIRDSACLPACGLFGGTKGNPVIVENGVGGWLEDGVMLELNPDPSESPFELQKNIHILLKKAAKVAESGGAKLKTGVATGVYRQEDLRKHPQVFVSGCDPDFDAYSGGAERNSPMAQAQADLGNNVFFAGGHVHIGLTDWPEELPKFVAARFLDILLYIPYLFMRNHAYSSRIPYYGLPGLFRSPKHGLEYRTPEPSWILEGITSPYFLGRAKAVGNLFKYFEDSKKELVSLYNKINWDALHAPLSAVRLAESLDALNNVTVRTSSGSVHCIELCGRVFGLTNYNYYNTSLSKVEKNDFNPARLEFDPTPASAPIQEPILSALEAYYEPELAEEAIEEIGEDLAEGFDPV